MEEAKKENGAANETPNTNNNHNKSQTLVDNTNNHKSRAKSCKGCVYYSSTLKSNSRNPLCVGITRSLTQVPRHIVGEVESDAKKDGRSMTDFKYGCIGYSVYAYGKDHPANAQGAPTNLPACVGLEILVDKRVKAPGSVPAHAPKKEDSHAYPQNRPQKPAHSVGEEFLNRFSRNATVVANGVVKNLRKVGNHIKDRVDDILYPYRRRPK